MDTRLALPLLLALPLAAQASPFSVTAGVVQGLPSLEKATHNRAGLTAGADWGTVLEGSGIAFQAGLALAVMPGKDWNGLRTSLTLRQVHGDVLVDTGSPATVIAGISANVWTMRREGTEDAADPLDADHHFPVRDARGLKLGGRLGVRWTFSPRWAVDVLLQQTELAGKDLADPLVRAGGVNPAWLEAGLRYRF